MADIRPRSAADDRMGRTLWGSAEFRTAGSPVSLCVSLAGANTFEVGNIVTQQYWVSTSGAISLQGVAGAGLRP